MLGNLNGSRDTSQRIQPIGAERFHLKFLAHLTIASIDPSTSPSEVTQDDILIRITGRSSMPEAHTHLCNT